MAVTVIVDMQPGFDASNSCLEGALKLVEKSIQYNSTVVLVELSPDEHGPTLKPITDLVKGYKKLLTTTKSETDGSRHVQKVLTDYNQAKLDVIRICGVNADYCVRATAIGLAEWYEKSKVILHYEATCGYSCQMHSKLEDALDDGLRWFKHIVPKNIVISKNNKIINFNKQNKKVA